MVLVDGVNMGILKNGLTNDGVELLRVWVKFGRQWGISDITADVGSTPAALLTTVMKM